MLINLYSEMKKRHIRQKDIADALNLSTNTISAKMNGKISFTVDEIKTLQKEFFPMCTMEYLTERA